MTKNIHFAQHVRTSSKARRGFRTFKRTLSEINEALDEKLSTYGVYTPTQYQDFHNMQPEDYPVLYLFYQLDGKRVLCKSTYVGEDLHSYPPRAGNYIAHSLLCDIGDRFDPIDLFKWNDGQNITKPSIWKTKDDIIREDDVAGVDLNIAPLEVPLTLIYDGKKNIREFLISGNRLKRHKQFLQAIDTIIDRKAIVIIDEKDNLEEWIFSLLLVFPIEFIFRQIKIASFVSSNLLMEVCNVVCIEPQNIEKIKRNIEYSSWEVINGDGLYEGSVYARAVLECVINDDENRFDLFRSAVFSEFTPSSQYTMEEFVKYTLFFTDLSKIHLMTNEQFEQFLLPYMLETKKVEAIYSEIRVKQDWNKSIVLWRCLREVFPTNKYSNYEMILSYYESNTVTDAIFIDFEQEVLDSIPFGSNISSLLKYYNSININELKRTEIYFLKSLEILNQTVTVEDKIIIINDILSNIKGLSDAQKKSFSDYKNYIELYKKIKLSDGKYQKIILALDNLKFIKEMNYLRQVADLLIKISWKEVFMLLEDKKDHYIGLFSEFSSYITLPNQNLLRLVCNRNYDDFKEEIYSLYIQLSEQEKNEFIVHSPKNIKNIILNKIPISKVEDLETFLEMYKETLDENLIVKKFIRDRDNDDQLWLFCSIINEPIRHNKPYSSLFKLSEFNKKLIYKIINEERIEVPNNYRALAEILNRRELIKRPVPKSYLEIDNNGLQRKGTFLEIQGIKEKLKGDLNEEDLINLVKPPWDYLYWKELSSNLNERDSLDIPRLVNSILHRYFNLKEKEKYKIWCYITCEYILYLILDNNEILFYKCVNKYINLDWGEFDFIVNRLLCTLTVPNNTSDYFLSQNNKNRVWNKRPF